MDDTLGLDNQLDDTLENNLTVGEGVTVERDALTLDVDDDDFIKTANVLIRTSQNFFKNTYRWEERTKKNEKYLWGRQLDDEKMKTYQKPYVDNILYESMAYTVPMSLQRLPDITVKAVPGHTPQEDQVNKDYASDLSQVVTSDLQSRERKQVLGMAYKHRPVYFYGVIKPFWNPEKGKDGDYDFTFVHPEFVVLDHTAKRARAEDMDFIAENVEYTVKEWVMRFPKKEKEFYEALRAHGVFSDTGKNEGNAEGMNTKVKGWEIWFTWYEKSGDGYQKLECVAWFYKDLLFDKMKHPYWDWSGEEQVLHFDKIATEIDYRDALANQQFDGFTTQTVFHNHLPYPEKPYIIVTYDQFGKVPIDETSELEQAILKQQDYDKRGRQITEMLDRARGKHVFSADSGLKAEDIEELDMGDPETDLLVKGEVQKVHAFIAGEQPSAPMIESFKDTRERIFSTMGANAATRGQVDADAPATSTQLGRQGDFSRNDNLTDDTINYPAEKMANWSLQFIKLFYTEEHMVSILGGDGQTLFKKVHRDMVKDGMQITISASGADKLNRQQNAMDMAKLKYTDPLSFYQDMNVNDPIGRTEKLMLFTMQPAMYLQKFIYGNGNAQSLSTALQQIQTTGSATGSPQAAQDIMLLQQGQVPPVPQQIDPAYLGAITQFIHTPQFEQMLNSSQNKQAIIQWLQAVQNVASGQGQQNIGTPEQPGAQPAPAQQPPAQPAVGPTTSTPNPANPGAVASTPPAGM